jgi:hypothetical protein
MGRLEKVMVVMTSITTLLYAFYVNASLSRFRVYPVDPEPVQPSLIVSYDGPCNPW